MDNDSKKLEVVNKLAAMLAHELRVPLTAIKNSIYFMKIIGIESHNPKIADHIVLINKEIDRCVQMIANLQNFVQPKAPVKKEVKLDELLTESLSQILIPSIIKVKTQFDKNLPLVAIDPFQIRQVFDNIIRNSIFAMEGGGILTVKTQYADNIAVIEFIDTGRGISTDNLEKIFDPLFTTVPHGIGLGLTVCKTFINAHGGKINITSAPEEGTNIKITLPLK